MNVSGVTDVPLSNHSITTHSLTEDDDKATVELQNIQQALSPTTNLEQCSHSQPLLPGSKINSLIIRDTKCKLQN